MNRIEPNQREIIGYSIKDENKKAQWIDLIKSIAKWVEDNNLAHDVVFHGTSSRRALNILENGMKPTDITHAISEGSLNDTGSFWGDVHTASAYAEDTIAERDPDSIPVLLMAYTAELEEDFDLRPDLATLDFPLKGLTKLDEKEVYDNWINNHRTLTWKQSLNELGAIIAVHDHILDPDYMRMITAKEDLNYLPKIERTKEPELSPFP